MQCCLFAFLLSVACCFVTVFCGQQLVQPLSNATKPEFIFVSDFHMTLKLCNINSSTTATSSNDDANYNLILERLPLH